MPRLLPTAAIILAAVVTAAVVMSLALLTGWITS